MWQAVRFTLATLHDASLPTSLAEVRQQIYITIKQPVESQTDPAHCIIPTWFNDLHRPVLNSGSDEENALSHAVFCPEPPLCCFTFFLLLSFGLIRLNHKGRRTVPVLNDL